jgi:hypothetical protein
MVYVNQTCGGKDFLCVPFAAINSICLCYDACFSYTPADQIGPILYWGGYMCQLSSGKNVLEDT